MPIRTNSTNVQMEMFPLGPTLIIMPAARGLRSTGIGAFRRVRHSPPQIPCRRSYASSSTVEGPKVKGIYVGVGGVVLLTAAVIT